MKHIFRHPHRFLSASCLLFATCFLFATLLMPAGRRRARENSLAPHLEQNLLNEPLTRQERKALKFLYK